MKFSRYLKDTQTPEWKKAYIDYRGLKKLITAIKKASENGDEFVPHPGPTTSTESPRSFAECKRGNVDERLKLNDQSRYGSMGSRLSTSGHGTRVTQPTTTIEAALESRGQSSHHTDNYDEIPGSPASDTTTVGQTSKPPAQPDQSRPQAFRSKTDLSLRRSETLSSLDHAAEAPPPSGFLANLRRRRTQLAHQRSMTASSRIPLPLSIIIASLTPLERQFIDKLDMELEKVENFFRERETEGKAKASILKNQLRELEDHRRLFYEAQNADGTWKSAFIPHNVAERIQERLPFSGSVRGKNPKSDSAASPSSPDALSPKNGVLPLVSRSPSPSHVGHGTRSRLDPDEYQSAKKHLKKAILEYYRGLELLNNYRVLNLTGFRKALKKFEKNFRANHIQQAYMQEKVEVSAISSGETVERLLKEMEDDYASRFEKGDIKKARGRLRATARLKTHHFSAFRSGLYIGCALPALIEGVYRSFLPSVREKIPWDILLYVYSILLVPVLFATLVGSNLWVWRRSRINYQFIFELDVRTQLDSREYLELPAFLLATLIYCFWLSFTDIADQHVAPTRWPILWIAFSLFIVFTPIPILFPSSRWWLVRKIGKLFLSGTKPVEFTDFWLGDQFCSLIFTLSGLFFVGCVNIKGFDDAWDRCSASTYWGIPFLLSSLPLFVRAVQSVKRYVDSRLYTHLINGGKYCSSIFYYAFYYAWRHHGRQHDHWLGLFILFASVASFYTTAWDLTMDWSFFKSNAQYRFLRKDLMYSSKYYIYYFVIVSNIIIRFQWIAYIPVSNSAFPLTTFIVGMAEMLRRWQWNFFRLENEHLGNTDQYRVTREVPLPYRTEDKGEDDDSDDDMDAEEAKSTRSSWRRRNQRSLHMQQMSSDERSRSPIP